MAGGRAERAVAAVRAMADEGVTALVSFGIAGGLDPALRPGALIVGEAVATGAGTLPCDKSLSDHLAAALAGAVRGIVAASESVVATAEAKRALHRATGALAVDMESGPAAEAARELGLPFVIVRAVADPAERGLPPAAARGLDENGNVRLGAVLLSLARSPGQLPGLVRVGLDTRAALKALAGAVPALASLG